MEFRRIGMPGRERPVVIHGSRTFDLGDHWRDIDSYFFEADGIQWTRNALASDRLRSIDVSGERVGPPVARPHAIWCIGMNYAAHAAESGSPPPPVPVLFFKTPNTIVGPGDPIMIPPGADSTDWEVELAVVIGRRARYLSSPDEARAHIAGFTISNDVSERRWQLDESGGQWSKGKCAETFNPLGPALVPVDELDAGDLRIRSWVNGEVRQDSRTSELIFGIDFLIWHLSQIAVLEPGDILNTGTPKGVALSGKFPYLRAGDIVDVEIEGIGRMRNHCVDV